MSAVRLVAPSESTGTTPDGHISPRASAFIHVELHSIVRRLRRALRMMGWSSVSEPPLDQQELPAHRAGMVGHTVFDCTTDLDDLASYTGDFEGGRLDGVLDRMKHHGELIDAAASGFKDIARHAKSESLRRYAVVLKNSNSAFQADLQNLLDSLRD
jgi:hypothetical protein